MNHRISCPVSQIRVKTPIFILNFPEYPCIRDSGMNFQPVMYNSRGGPECFLLRLVVTAHLVQVKFIERGAERLPLIEDALPRKPCLKAFKDQHLKELRIIPNQLSPLLVVITDIQFILWIRPAAAVSSIVPFHTFISPCSSFALTFFAYLSLFFIQENINMPYLSF